jgi:hypothetical protein
MALPESEGEPSESQEHVPEARSESGGEEPVVASLGFDGLVHYQRSLCIPILMEYHRMQCNLSLQVSMQPFDSPAAPEINWTSTQL